MDANLIPGTKGFRADTKGNIYGPNGKIRNQYTNGDGYLTASVLLNNGKWQTFGVHRLVALANIPLVGDLNDFTVNHKNKNIKDNNINNLEWVSVHQNNIHASLMRKNHLQPSILAKSPKGDFSLITNIEAMAKMFNIEINFAWELIKDKKEFNGWCFKFLSSGASIPKELHKRNFDVQRENGIPVPKAVKFLNIHSNQTLKFDSYWKAGEYFKVSPSHIFQCITRNNKKRLFKKEYLIVPAEDDFPVLSKEERDKLISHGGKEVIAYNVEANKFCIYSTAALFIRENKLSKKAVTTDLKKNRLRFLQGWWFTYFVPENVVRLKAAVNIQ